MTINFDPIRKSFTDKAEPASPQESLGGKSPSSEIGGKAPQGSAPHECPDGLLPDGDTCPRCGKSRAPSGIDGGTWVHFPREPKRVEDSAPKGEPVRPHCEKCNSTGVIVYCDSCNGAAHPQPTEGVKVLERGVDIGFKTAQVNQAEQQLRWWFDEKEAAVIDALAAKQEISRERVLKQALRTYQLVAEGIHDLVERNPMPKAQPTEGGEPFQPYCPLCRSETREQRRIITSLDDNNQAYDRPCRHSWHDEARSSQPAVQEKK